MVSRLLVLLQPSSTLLTTAGPEPQRLEGAWPVRLEEGAGFDFTVVSVELPIPLNFLPAGMRDSVESHCSKTAIRVMPSYPVDTCVRMQALTIVAIWFYNAYVRVHDL